jgi:hypothetical protein
MNLRLFRSFPVCRFILQVAALLVPGRERAEWLAEWQAELWHVWQAYSRKSRDRFRGGQAVTDFCLGAFRDALWLRWNNPQPISRRGFRIGSASRCSLCLALLTAISLSICLYLPGARMAIRPSHYMDADGLVTISRGGYSGTQFPTIEFGDYQSWKTSTRHLFTDVAFYQPVRKRIHIAKDRSADLSVGRASENLFKLLSLPVSANAGDPANGHYGARLFLSQKIWRGLFGGDPGVIGSVTEIAGQRVLVAGVLSRDSIQLPGPVDAWLLEDERHLDMLPPTSRGFVLAHMRTSGWPRQTDGWLSMTVPREKGDSELFDCISLAQQSQLPFTLFLFTLAAALVTLPATTALPLGEYPRHSVRLPWAGKARRWVFLSSKFLLIVPLVYLTSIDVAYGVPSLGSTTAQYLQLVISFFGLLFAFRWILQDQRKRCPLCLRVLSNPARVGQASRNFLAWNGTELICTGGHGLLHIPELPTSWFGTQRWLYLDPSWGSLFTDACVPSAGFV